MNWRYQHNWSPAELQAIGIFAEKSLPKLRRIQDCIRQQLGIVHNKPDNWDMFGNPHNSRNEIVWRLQRMELILAAAVDKKCFNERS